MASTALTTALGVHGGGVDVAAVLRNQAVPEQQHVAAGKGDLAPVEAGVVHVELGDQRISVAPHAEDLMPKPGDRTDERADCLDERRLALDRFCVAKAQANVVGHERSQPRDILRVEGGEHPVDVVGGGHATCCDQLARVPSKSIVACVPSQNGLFDECPQRHIAIGSGCSITCPSGAVRTTGPETMYGPSSLGVMVMSGMAVTFR